MKSHKFGMTKVKIVDFFYINPQIPIPIVISSRVGVRPFMTDGRTDSGMPSYVTHKTRVLKYICCKII